MNAQPDSSAAFRVGPEGDPDRYGLGAAVGSGAEGILYRGSITTGAGLELEVAIKMLQPRFLDRVDEWHERWMEQVELVRSLHVPGMVLVRDGFIGPMPHARGQSGEGRTLYLVMNWVDGEALDEWVRHRPDRDPLDDLKILVQVAAALDLMHSGRATGGIPIIHRDVKPSNILITESGAVLVDFGLTRGLPSGQELTGITGTPGYMSPEVLEEGLYSPASDRYALGAVAFFIMTGHDLPTGGSPQVLRGQLDTVPTLSERADVVDHLMAMLNADPALRPLGLANWLGQLRNSSLLPRREDMTPPAPVRQVKPSKRATRRAEVSHKGRRRTVPLAVGLLIVALASGGVLTAHLLTGPAATPALLSFDPTCGQGSPVPALNYLPAPLSPASAFAVSPSGSILAGPQLTAFNSGCTQIVGFQAEDCHLSTITALTIADAGRSIFAAGFDRSFAGGVEQGGWVVAKYHQPSGALDPNFGTGGCVVYPERGSGTAHPTGGQPTAIMATGSRVFVIGTDGGAHCCVQTLIVSLLSSGRLDTHFNASQTKGVRMAGPGTGSFWPVAARTTNGSVLVGDSYAAMGCGFFTIENYTPSGERVSAFKPIRLSGTGTFCPGGRARIPGFTAAELTALIALPGGKFAGVGVASSFSGAEGQEAYEGFIVRFKADGALDSSFGHDGVVMLPGLNIPANVPVGHSDPDASALGAVAQPSGGFVVAMVKANGVYLVFVTPSGQVGQPQRRIETASAKPPAIATGDAGDGRIEIMTFSSSQWRLGRYLGVDSTTTQPSG